MASAPRITVPLGRRFRLWRSRALMVFFWIACWGAAFWIARDRQEHIETVGVVYSHEWIVAGIEPGIVSGIAVDFYQPVQANDIIVTLDKTAHMAELEVVSSELALAKANLETEYQRYLIDASQNRLDQIDEKRRLLVDYEQARLDHLDRLVAIEVDRATVQRLDFDIQRIQKLVSETYRSQSELDNLKLDRAIVAKRIEENLKLSEISKTQMEATEERLNWAEASITEASSNALFAPFHAQIDLEEARIKQLLQVETVFNLRAPVSGIVTQIFRRPGEAVMEGEPIVTIADTHASRVFAYIDEKAAVRIQPGAAATIRLTDEGGPIINTHVVKIGPSVAEIPIRNRLRFDIPEWGVPALIDIPANVNLLPGKKVNVSIIPGKMG